MVNREICNLTTTTIMVLPITILLPTTITITTITLLPTTLLPTTTITLHCTTIHHHTTTTIIMDLRTPIPTLSIAPQPNLTTILIATTALQI